MTTVTLDMQTLACAYSGYESLVMHEGCPVRMPSNDFLYRFGVEENEGSIGKPDAVHVLCDGYGSVRVHIHPFSTDDEIIDLQLQELQDILKHEAPLLQVVTH